MNELYQIAHLPPCFPQGVSEWPRIQRICMFDPTCEEKCFAGEACVPPHHLPRFDQVCPLSSASGHPMLCPEPGSIQMGTKLYSHHMYAAMSFRLR